MELPEFLQEKLARPATGWGIGVFGALAEFQRDADEPAEVSDFTIVTARGAIRLEPVEQCRPVPYQPRSPKQHDRNFGVALCLPEPAARVGRHSVLTELGPDREALRPADRSALLFDLGLATPYVIFCVRTGDDMQIARLRSGLGRPLLEPGNPLFAEIARMSPQRVLISRLGRIEVYQRIGEVGGKTPAGPHTHLLPKLVGARRTHSANALLPPGLVPCATCYPDRVAVHDT